MRSPARWLFTLCAAVSLLPCVAGLVLACAGRWAGLSYADGDWSLRAEDRRRALVLDDLPRRQRAQAQLVRQRADEPEAEFARITRDYLYGPEGAGAGHDEARAKAARKRWETFPYEAPADFAPPPVPRVRLRTHPAAVAAIAAIPAVAWLTLAAAAAARARRRGGGGYDLRGSAGRCPECGAAATPTA